MGWDLTILAIHDAEMQLSEAVPDVFGPQPGSLTFEEASSVALSQDLAAARAGDWVFVFDVWHRIGGHPATLSELSDGREIWIFRISDQPEFSSWKNGKCIKDVFDTQKIKGELEKLKMVPPQQDPESLSIALFRVMTGVSFPFDAEFTRFALD